MIKTNFICDSNLCTGCGACSCVCPRKCIKMIKDDEGFLYPVIDTTTCINCNLCRNTCPVNKIVDLPVLNGYIGRNTDVDVLGESTSGGAFSAFATYILNTGGFVYGAGIDDNKEIRHFGISKNEEKRLIEMRGSKYVQSDLKNTFCEIKQNLMDGKNVLFCGTPCQVAGLKAYLNHPFDGLFTVDIICRGVASPAFYFSYLNYMEERYHSKIKFIRFRNKTYGYHSGTMMIEFFNNKRYFGSGRIDYLLKAFFEGSCSRESCYHCPFKGDNKYSDLTIFEAWHMDRILDGKKDDDKGYTSIFVRTEKGNKLLKESSAWFNFWGADVNKMKAMDGIMVDNLPNRSQSRDYLIVDCLNNGFSKSVHTYLKIKKHDYLIEHAKRIVYRIPFLKKIVYKSKGKTK